jgi:hypothetical protein
VQLLGGTAGRGGLGGPVLVLSQSGDRVGQRTQLGDQREQLGYPHTSAVQGFTGLRELRPRAGRSLWRVLYRRVSDVFVLAAVGPEAQSDQRGLGRAARQAVAEIEED